MLLTMEMVLGQLQKTNNTKTFKENLWKFFIFSRQNFVKNIVDFKKTIQNFGFIHKFKILIL